LRGFLRSGVVSPDDRSPPGQVPGQVPNPRSAARASTAAFLSVALRKSSAYTRIVTFGFEWPASFDVVAASGTTDGEIPGMAAGSETRRRSSTPSTRAPGRSGTRMDVDHELRQPVLSYLDLLARSFRDDLALPPQSRPMVPFSLRVTPNLCNAHSGVHLLLKRRHESKMPGGRYVRGRSACHES